MVIKVRWILTRFVTPAPIRYFALANAAVNAAPGRTGIDVRNNTPEQGGDCSLLGQVRRTRPKPLWSMWTLPLYPSEREAWEGSAPTRKGRCRRRRPEAAGSRAGRSGDS